MRKRRGRRSVESLERLQEEAAERLSQQEQDPEEALHRLIAAMSPAEPVSQREPPPEPGPREFECAACHLMVDGACLADPDRWLCRDCARDLDEGKAPWRRPRVESVCPACGRTMLVPEREDARCGFHCPGCGVHLRRRAGHLHLEWNHREHPDARHRTWPEAAPPVRAPGETLGQRADLHHAVVLLKRALALPGPRSAGIDRAREALAGLRGALAHHVRTTEGLDGLFEQIVSDVPHMAAAVARLRGEHQALGEAVGAGTALLEGGPLEDARSGLSSLAARVARHRLRCTDVVYEAYEVDVGEGPG